MGNTGKSTEIAKLRNYVANILDIDYDRQNNSPPKIPPVPVSRA